MRKTREQKLYKQARLKGNTVKDSMRIAGYKITKNNRYGYTLDRKLGIKELIDKHGLDDSTLINIMKDNIMAGSTIKATADTTHKYITTILAMKGYLKDTGTSGDTTNIFINELKTSSDKELIDRLNAIDSDIVNDIQ